VTDNEKLLRKAQALDPDALGELYDLYAPLMYSYLYRRVQDAAVAEDLTSEVFVRMLRALQAGQEWHTSLRAWLYRVAHNLAMDHFRRQPAVPPLQLDERLIAHEDDVDDQVERRLYSRELANALRTLTPDQQQVLTLRFGEHLTAREVSEIMDRSVGAVEALQHRALEALRRLFARHGILERA
jgi:RNA polymerase sigma-70 factor (ECF subfamily)